MLPPVARAGSLPVNMVGLSTRPYSYPTMLTFVLVSTHYPEMNPSTVFLEGSLATGPLFLAGRRLGD